MLSVQLASTFASTLPEKGFPPDKLDPSSHVSVQLTSDAYAPPLTVTSLCIVSCDGGDGGGGGGDGGGIGGIGGGKRAQRVPQSVQSVAKAQ